MQELSIRSTDFTIKVVERDETRLQRLMNRLLGHWAEITIEFNNTSVLCQICREDLADDLEVQFDGTLIGLFDQASTERPRIELDVPKPKFKDANEVLNAVKEAIDNCGHSGF